MKTQRLSLSLLGAGGTQRCPGETASQVPRRGDSSKAAGSGSHGELLRSWAGSRQRTSCLRQTGCGFAKERRWLQANRRLGRTLEADWPRSRLVAGQLGNWSGQQAGRLAGDRQSPRPLRQWTPEPGYLGNFFSSTLLRAGTRGNESNHKVHHQKRCLPGPRWSECTVTSAADWEQSKGKSRELLQLGGLIPSVCLN